MKPGKSATDKPHMLSPSYISQTFSFVEEIAVTDGDKTERRLVDLREMLASVLDLGGERMEMLGLKPGFPSQPPVVDVVGRRFEKPLLSGREKRLRPPRRAMRSRTREDAESGRCQANGQRWF
jgi:hypothetical protein